MSCIDQDFIDQKNKLQRGGVLHAVDALVNLSTANYLLRGIQQYHDNTEMHQWQRLIEHLGMNRELLDQFPHTDGGKFALATHIVKYLMTPLGVARGSEKQGGQHQVNLVTIWS
jgi:hypothetical protein